MVALGPEITDGVSAAEVKSAAPGALLSSASIESTTTGLATALESQLLQEARAAERNREGEP